MDYTLLTASDQVEIVSKRIKELEAEHYNNALSISQLQFLGKDAQVFELTRANNQIEALVNELLAYAQSQFGGTTDDSEPEDEGADSEESNN